MVSGNPVPHPPKTPEHPSQSTGWNRSAFGSRVLASPSRQHPERKPNGRPIFRRRCSKPQGTRRKNDHTYARNKIAHATSIKRILALFTVVLRLPKAWPIAYCAPDETSPRPRPQTQNFTRSRSPGWHHRLRDSESRPATSVQPVRAPGAGTSHSLNDGGSGGMHGALAVAVAAAREEGKSTLCHGTPASSRQRWKAAIVFEFRSCLGRGGSGRRRRRVQVGLHKPGCLALSHACISSRKPSMPLQHQSGALLCVSSARPNSPRQMQSYSVVSQRAEARAYAPRLGGFRSPRHDIVNVYTCIMFLVCLCLSTA